MRLPLRVALAAAALALTATPAYAHPDHDYTGGCEIDVVGDGTNSPQTTWTGEARVAVVATTAGDPAAPAPTVSISAECRLYIDGVFDSVVASASGTGAAADVVPGFTLQMSPDSVASLCAVVSVGGEQHTNCADVTLRNQPTVPPVPPVPPVTSAVVGYIYIVHTAETGGPVFTVHGDLATPQWTCAASPASSASPYTVTCTPTAVVPFVGYRCDVLHADVKGVSSSARARTSMDCDGDKVYEAQTAAVEGVDYEFVWSTSPVAVTKFQCVVDGGPATPGPARDWHAGCGDPGLVTVG